MFITPHYVSVALRQIVIFGTFFISAVLDTIRPQLFCVKILVYKGNIENSKYFFSNPKASLAAKLWLFKVRSAEG